MQNRIKETRIAQGLSQERLAEMAGVSRPTISKLENDEPLDVKVSTIQAIAKALNKTVQYLFF